MTTQWNFSSDTVTGDVTLYAKWVDESDAAGCEVLTAEDFTIDGTSLSIKVSNTTETFALSSAITVSPYATWTITTDKSGLTEISSATVTLSVGDNIFYINVVSGTGSNKKQYTVNIRRRGIYTVVYQPENGENSVTDRLEEDSVAENKTYTKTGYTFKEWQHNGIAWDFEDGVTADMTLIAVWTANEYTVTFNSNDGNQVAADKVVYNSAYSFTVPEKRGYAFNGWKTANGTLLTDKDGKSLSAWDIIGDTVLYADWSATEYTITYENSIGATNTNPAKYTIEDSTITLVAAVKEGYTFDGWYSDIDLTQSITEIDVNSAANIIVYAKWTLNEYTASFYADGQLIDSVTFTIETESLTEPVITEKTGYQGTWPSYTISANNLTINAIYTPINYTITYEDTKNVENGNTTSYTIESEPITLSDIAVDGYTFLGWYNGDDWVTQIATGSYGDLMLTAKWEIITYSITYTYNNTIGELSDGATLRAIYTVEDEFIFAELTSKTVGYIFDGWYTQSVSGGDKVEGIALGTTGNKTYYAQWELETYIITYHNTENATNTNETNYTIESGNITIGNVSRTGYTFEGWYSDEDLTVAANTTITTGSTGDLDFYAKWSVIDYTITYNLDGGTNNDDNPGTYTIESSAALANPTRSGYYFVGWYSAAESGELVMGITQGTTGNLTLYARWITIDCNGGTDGDYTVTFDANGVEITGTPAKTYYEFAGWYTDSNITSAYDNSLPASSMTLYAKWSPVEYTINYVLDGGTNSESNPATYNIEDAVTFAAPSKTGYTFIGWYSDETFTSAAIEGISEGSYGEITIYANYSVNQYTINFESNGGTDVAAITQNYATEVTAPAKPAKNGYAFVGWYSDSLLTNSYMFTTMPAEDITLYAKWAIVIYNIEYDLDGGINSTSNPSVYTVTSETITLVSPAKTGYTFSGWYTDSKYTIQITQIESGSYGDLEIFAKWEAIYYTISYEIDAKAVNTNITEYTIETDLTTLIDATFTGYSFNGWYSDSSYTTAVTTIAGGSIGNITLYGKFSVNTYNVWLDGSEEASVTVTFDLNGASGTAPAAQTITATVTLTYPDVPTRSGYVFGGWYTTAECSGSPFDFSGMIGSDITLYARWVDLDGANGIDINGTATVTLSGTTEQVYYFVPLASGNVSITTTGDIDTLGMLYKDGTLLKQNDDKSSTDTNFLITYNVTAGEVYEIRVRAFNSSTSGEVILSVSGSDTVAAGGYTCVGNITTITYGSSDYTIAVPTTDTTYKFLGWADVNGVYYTDEEGNAIRAWDIGEDTGLYSQWEKMVYTVTFVVNGGTEVSSVELEYGERLDLNLYTTTKSGYTFVGWYLNTSDTEAYSASTMPGENITLYAKWTTYSLGSIKYDADKIAISENDELTAELFSAFCIDTDGMPATFTVTINGSQTAGNTITIRLVATVGTKSAQKTISGIKVYGAPTLTVNNADIGYVNLSELDGDWFGASGTDTFGNATTITVRIEGEYSAGDTVTIYIDSTDVAGNVTTQAIEGVLIYGSPVISITDIDIKSINGISLDSLGATAVDSFGESIEVGISTIAYSYETTTDYNYIYFTALASESYTLYYKNGTSGGRTYIYVYCVTTNSAVLSNSYYTNTSFASMTFSVTAGYEYYIRTYAYGSSYTTTFSMYFESPSANISAITSAVEYDITLSATDSKGNVGTRTLTLKVYSSPIISEATTTEFTESDDITVETLGITATDTYGEELEITLTLTSGTQVGGNTMIYTATVTDVAGNITTREFSVKIYGTPTITVGRTDLTVEEAENVVNTNIVVDDAVTEASATVSISGTTEISYYFISSASGSLTMQTSSSIDTYGSLYKDGSLLTSNADGGTDHNFLITYSVTAGELYEIRVRGYSSSTSGTATLTISGDVLFAFGTTSDISTFVDALNSSAVDSFGDSLNITYELKSGEYKGGTEVVYTLTATDKLGNTATLDVTVKIYDQNEIKLLYGDMVTSIIKATSQGEEFVASATDSFGNACDISIIAADGYTLEAGNTISLYIVATDVAGNTKQSSLISDIKVYGVPTISASTDPITETTDFDWYYSAYDSFGEELVITVTIVSGTQTAGDTLTVRVTATDTIGNIAVEVFTYTVESAE